MAANSISTIPVEVFATYVVEKLRKTNPFLQYAVDESSSVLGGAVVHIPQAGASPTVVKNRSTFPATAVMRTDSFVTYSLNVFSTTPTHITWHEENEISYDKTDSVLRDHVETLMETVGDEILYAWVTGTLANGNADTIPAASVIRTSGSSVAATESGQTGNRKALSYADVQAAQALMNKHSPRTRWQPSNRPPTLPTALWANWQASTFWSAAPSSPLPPQAHLSHPAPLSQRLPNWHRLHGRRTACQWRWATSSRSKTRTIRSTTATSSPHLSKPVAAAAVPTGRVSSQSYRRPRPELNNVTCDNAQD